jgi:CDP-glycerol glycerophosphotransferase
VPPGVEFVVAGSRAYYRLLARATYFVNNVNFPSHWRKRDGSVHLQTHHGTPLKRMGLDLREAFVAGQQMDFDALLRRCSRWDYSLSSNPLSTEVWKRVYPVPCTTLEYGYPRNDPLANATDEDVAKARCELGIDAGKKVLLYAPTHREYEPEFRLLLDTAQLASSLGDGWVVLSRAHYFYDNGEQVSPSADGRVIDVTNHDSIEQLSIASDVLITDYSSLLFDYAVLDRPIVVYAPDWETYRLMRGTTFDLLAEPPGVVCRTPEEVVDVLLSGGHAAESANERRAEFRAKFCAWDDGHAAERVVRRLFLGEDPALPWETAA